jgi:hypothetical protein
MLPFRSPVKMLPRPGVSYDGRSPTSTYWGVSTKMVKMCPHVIPGGGQCGLTAEFCICTCLLCGSLMEARKRCGRRLTDGSICPWGQDRSPEVSSPEQDPAPPPKRKRLHWRHAAYGTKSSGGSAAVAQPSPSLPPARRSPSPPRSAAAPTAASNAPHPRPPTVWRRTVTGAQKRGNPDGLPHPFQ